MDKKDFLSFTSKEKMLLNFMETTIKKVNICLSGLFTLQKVLIEKGLISEAELLSKLRVDLKLPMQEKGAKTLEEMIQDLYEENSEKEKL